MASSQQATLIACDSVDVFTSILNLVIVHGISRGVDLSLHVNVFRSARAIKIWLRYCGICSEVISLHPVLSPPTLTSEQSTRACNAFTLLQELSSIQKLNEERGHVGRRELSSILNTTTETLMEIESKENHLESLNKSIEDWSEELDIKERLLKSLEKSSEERARKRK